MPSRAPTVIVLGAGASGLAAAAKLVRAGLAVTVVEARDRLGGRVDTRTDPRLGIPVEHGAEFVHGRPAIVQRLARAGHVRLAPVDGRLLAFDGGALRAADRAFERAQSLLDAGAGDGPFSDVLAGPRAQALSPLERRLARGFVEGYYLAAPRRQGRAALRAMTRSEGEIGADEAFRALDGQAALLAPLARAVLAKGELRLGTRAERVRWRPGRVEVRGRGRVGAPVRLAAERLVVTLPPALLARGAAVRFRPALRDKERAAARVEMGPVVKVLLRFRRAFWRERRGRGRGWPDLAFLLAPALPVPTWWTPLPLDAARLIGWAGGPAAARLAKAGERDAVAAALATLARVFAMPRSRLEDLVDGADVASWADDPLAGGAYAVFPPGTADVPGALAAPVAGTIFFAGEATVLGSAGTVHGALESGERAAAEVLRSFRG
ncbi:MAG: flavin monoamine oxidase family protein [Anaeromyxobacteraceae bacterium]